MNLVKFDEKKNHVYNLIYEIWAKSDIVSKHRRDEVLMSILQVSFRPGTVKVGVSKAIQKKCRRTLLWTE